jgi:hypothetical protein
MRKRKVEMKEIREEERRRRGIRWKEVNRDEIRIGIYNEEGVLEKKLNKVLPQFLKWFRLSENCN